MRVLSRRRIPPMPIEDLIDHPARKALPSAARNMVDELCTHFWSTECRPFPKDEDTVFGIVRAHRPTFRRHKANVLAIFEEIRPRLEVAWRARASSIDNLKHLRARRTANERMNRATQGETQTLALATPKHSWHRKQKLAEGRFAAPPCDADGEFFRDC
jgi:hypothetical protein